MQTKSVRDKLHRLVEELPQSELPAAERFLEFLRTKAWDDLVEVLANAPEEEPEEDEIAAIQEGMDAVARGDVVSDEELRRELGL